MVRPVLLTLLAAVACGPVDDGPSEVPPFEGWEDRSTPIPQPIDVSRIRSGLPSLPGVDTAALDGLVQSGDAEAITAHVADYLEEHPGSGTAVFILGVVALRAGDVENAQRLLGAVGGSAPVEEVSAPLHLESVAQTLLSDLDDRLSPSPERFLIQIAQEVLDPIRSGAGSVAFLDVEHDGDPDIFVNPLWAGERLLINDGRGHFSDRTAASGFNTLDQRACWSSLAADFDRDGDEDLFCGRGAWFGLALDELYMNDGVGHFVAEAGFRGMALADDSFGCGAADFDLDGDLDIFVGNGAGQMASPDRPFPDRLWVNDAAGEFTDAAGDVGLDDGTGPNIGQASFDVDGDGDTDIVVMRMGAPDSVYLNEGGRFVDRIMAEQALVTDVMRRDFMAIPLDYDNDGLLDLLTTAELADHEWGAAISTVALGGTIPLVQANRLLRNTGAPFGSGRYVDVTSQVGLDRIVASAMAAGVGDLNNDGFVDLVFGNGNPPLWRLDRNVVALGSASGVFLDRTTEAGVYHLGKGHGIAFADIDRDGDLDMYNQNGAAVGADTWPDALYGNLRAGRPDARAIQVVLTGTRSTAEAVGAEVRVRVGDSTMTRVVMIGTGFGVTDERVLHFGLGGADGAESIEVRWPGTPEPQRLGPVEAGRRVSIVEGALEPKVTDFGPPNLPLAAQGN